MGVCTFVFVRVCDRERERERENSYRHVKTELNNVLDKDVSMILMEKHILRTWIKEFEFYLNLENCVYIYIYIYFFKYNSSQLISNIYIYIYIYIIKDDSLSLFIPVIHHFQYVF